jgi:ACS family sodium-dependent inorganic phosphate cotransporter-like MFS transporter 9
VLERFGWRYTFHLIGVLTLVWVYYFKNFAIIKTRAKLNILNSKEALLTNSNGSLDDGNSTTVNLPSPVVQSSGSSSSSQSSVPWMEILTKPAFWSLIVAHVCQNNAYYILLTWLPTYFQENFPGSRGWVFNVVPWFISMPSTIFAGWMADKLIARSKNSIFLRCYYKISF